MPSRIPSYVRSLLFRRRLEREMQEEMEAHLEHATERLVARGVRRSDAERAARREFGNVGVLQEEARDARGWRWVERLLADIAFTFRYFQRRPFFAGTVVGVLALGIAINVGVFVAIHSFMTMPAPGIARDDAVVRIRPLAERPGIPLDWRDRMSYPEVLEHASSAELYAEVAAWAPTVLAVSLGADESGLESAAAQYVTESYFTLLGVEPILGSAAALSAPADAMDPPLVAVVGHEFWRERLGGTSEAVGRTIRVNDQPVQVVGVAPARFAGPDATGNEVDLWLPLSTRPLIAGTTGYALASWDSTYFSAVARLRPGITAERASVVAAEVGRRAGEAAPDRRRNATWSAEVVPLRGQNARAGGGDEVLVAALALAIALLSLAVTCTNVASLLVGAAAARRREIAARLALGASRGRVIRQLLTETIVLAGAAGTLGVAAVWALVRWVGPLVPELSLEFNFALGWPVAAFTLALSVGVGVVFGISPAMHATRVALSEVLKDTAAAVAGSRMLLQRSLVVGQVAVTQPLLVGLAAALLIVLGEFRGLESTALSERILWLQPGPSAANVSTADRDAQMDRVRERLAATPGIEAVIPNTPTSILRVAAHPGDAVPGVTSEAPFELDVALAPAGYFEMTGMPIVAGRDFDPSERLGGTAPNAGTIVMGRELARRLWGDANPLGRRLVAEGATISEQPGERAMRRPVDDPAAGLVVIGVVDQDAGIGAGYGIRSELAYLPFSNLSRLGLLVRTEDPAAPLVPTIHGIVQQEAPGMVVSSAVFSEMEARGRRVALNASAAAAGAGLLALLLSAVGLYAVVAFSVVQRTREIGVRSAIGARPARIVGLFLGQGVRLSAVGLAIGLPLSLVAWRTIEGEFGAPPVSTAALVATVGTAVLLVASLATWLPARRAAGIRPIEALRAD